MELYEAITRAGIVTIIRRVQSGEWTPGQARKALDARLQELTENDRIAYNRLVAQVAMDIPAIVAEIEASS